VDDPHTTTSDSDGWWKLNLRNERVVTVLVTHPGFIDTIQIATDQSRLYFRGEYWIELFPPGGENFADETRPDEEPSGDVVLNFQPYGSARGVRAAVAIPGGEPWIFDAEDEPVRSDTFGPDPFVGEVAYEAVEPGRFGVTVTSPPGLECAGPSEIPVRKDTSTRSYYFCEATKPPAEDGAH
jgi:hypothetical protein